MGKIGAIIGVVALAGVGFYVGKKIMEKNANEKKEHVYDESELFVEEKHSTPKEKLQKASLFAVGAIRTGADKFKEGIDEIINNDMVAKGEDTVTETKKLAMETKEKTVKFANDTKEKAVNFANDTKDKAVNFANDTKDKAVNFANEAKEKAKDAGEAVKGEIENLKNMVSSINTTGADAEEADELDDFENSLLNPTVEDIEITANEFVEKVIAEDVSSDAEDEGDAIAPSFDEIDAGIEAEDIVEEIGQEDEIDAAADDIDSISLDALDTETVDTFDFSNSEQL